MHILKNVRIFISVSVLASCGAIRDVETSATLSALQTPNVERLFKQNYKEQYLAGYCGPNITNFLRTLVKAGEPVDTYRVITIENRGFSVFGMVNAETARGTRFNEDALEEKNWYHHVILVDVKTLAVFDFDYMITPTIVKLDEYIETMFLDEPECNKGPGLPGQFCAGRKNKLADYQWKSVAAQDILRGGREEPPSNVFKMKDAMTELPGSR